MDLLQGISWELLVAGGGVITGVVAFVQNVLAIKKLRLENQVLREKLSERAGHLDLPTLDEVRKYGRAGRFPSRSSLLLLVLIVVLGGIAGALGIRVTRLENDVSAYKELRAFTEIIKEGLTSGNRRAVHAVVALAWLYIDQGNYNMAESLLREAIAAWRQSNMRDYEAMHALLVSLGEVSIRLGDYHTALSSFTEVLDLSQEMGSVADELIGLNGKGRALTGLGRYGEAEKVLEASLARSRQLGDRQWEISVLVNLADLFKVQRKYEMAEAVYREALDLSAKLGPEDLTTANILSGLAEVYRQTGREGEAAELEQRAAHIRKTAK